MEAKHIVEGIAALVMAVGIIGLVINRIKTGKGIGVRAIQFSGIVMLPSVILILGLEQVT